MYLRYHVWQDVLRLTSQSEDGWSNELRLDFSCVDIRFFLNGYGWKPNSGDENIDVLHEGEYKCYYRKYGTSDWTMFSRVTVERAATDDSTVYKEIVVSTGLIPEDFYEVKIEATKGETFESWGGAIEGINKNHTFYYNLQMRAAKPVEVIATDSVHLTEWDNAGKEILELNVDDVAWVYDILKNGFVGYQIDAVDIDIVEIQEHLNFLTETYQTIWDVVWVTESVTMFNPVQYAFAYEDISIEEFASVIPIEFPLIVSEDITITEVAIAAGSILYIQPYEDLTVTETKNVVRLEVPPNEVFVDVDLIYVNEVVILGFPDISEWENISVTEVFTPFKFNILQPNEYEALSIVEYINIEISVIYLSAYEDVSVTEVVIPQMVSYIFVYEDMTSTVDEAITVDLEIDLSAWQDVTVLETVIMHDIIVEMEVYDLAQIFENTQVNVLAVPGLDFSVIDLASIIETVSMHDIIIDILAIDTVSVAEDIEIIKTLLEFSIFEEPLITEVVSLVSKTEINSITNIGIQESVVMLPYYFVPGDINVYDSVDITEVTISGKSLLELESSSTIILLHLDGVDASQVATDSSYWNHGYTFTDDAGERFELDTVQKKFGTASILCPIHSGSAAKLSIDNKDLNEFEIGTKDYFIEFRWRRTNVWASGETYYAFMFTSGYGQTIELGFLEDSGDIIIFNTGGVALTSSQKALDTWHTFAHVRKGTQLFWFMDGELAHWKQTPIVDFADVHPINGKVYIGSYPVGTDWQFDGWIDEVIFLSDAYVYDTNYTPRNTAYDDPTILNVQLTIDEYAECRILDIRDIWINESVSVNEATSLSLSELFMSSYQAVSITEVFDVYSLRHDVFTYEEISVGESTTLIEAYIFMVASEDIAVNDVLDVEIHVDNFNVFDEVSIIAEDVVLTLDPLGLIVSDIITVTADEFCFSYDCGSDCNSFYFPMYLNEQEKIGNTIETGNPAGTIHFLVPNASTNNAFLYIDENDWSNRNNHMFFFNQKWEVHMRIKFTQKSTDRPLLSLTWHNKDLNRNLVSFDEDLSIGNSGVMSIPNAWTNDDTWHDWVFEIVSPGYQAGGNYFMVKVWKDGTFLGELIDSNASSTKTGLDVQLEIRTIYGNADVEWYLDFIKFVRLQDYYDDTLNVLGFEASPGAWPYWYIRVQEDVTVTVV